MITPGRSVSESARTKSRALRCRTKYLRLRECDDSIAKARGAAALASGRSWFPGLLKLVRGDEIRWRRRRPTPLRHVCLEMSGSLCNVDCRLSGDHMIADIFLGAASRLSIHHHPLPRTHELGCKERSAHGTVLNCVCTRRLFEDLRQCTRPFLPGTLGTTRLPPNRHCATAIF